MAPVIILIRIIGARVSRWSLVLITVTTAAITAAITVTDTPSLFASDPRAAASPAARFFYAPRYSKALCHDLPDGSARVGFWQSCFLSQLGRKPRLTAIVRLECWPCI